MGNGVTRKPVVLVVDDDAGVRLLLQVALTQSGFDVIVAQDGRRAVELYRADPAAIDVALVDLKMAGLDGPQTLAALREVNPALPALFMSGSWACYSPEELRRDFAVPVLSKPFSLEAVVKGVRQLLPAGALPNSGP